jgi:hypothetical protein
MPNRIKYTTTPTSNTIKVGSFALGVVTGVTYAPTSTTSFYNGYNVPSGGYVVYQNKATLGPSVFAPTGDTQMVNLTKALGNTTATTINDSLKWINEQNTIIAVNREYENIVTSGLTVLLDAGFTPSYPLSGTSWTDLSFSGNNGTLLNTPTYSSGSSGTLIFSATSLQYVTVPNIGNLSNWTVEAWFNLTAALTGKVTSIISNELNSSVINFSIGTNNHPTNTNLAVGFYNGTWRTTSGFTPTTSIWYQVAGTYDGSTIRQYVNGVASGGILSYVGTPTSGGNIRIMRRWDDTLTSTNFTDGILSNVKIYNRALSASEVLQNYNAQFSRLPPSLAGSLVFNGSNQSLGLSPGITFGAGAFTVEGWFYNNSSFVTKGILGSPVTSPTGCMNLFFTSSTIITSDKNGGGGQFNYTMGSAISLNAWHYLIYNRNSGGVTAVYIDGVRCTATSNDTLNYNTATDTVARHYGGYFSGYWTNMRITIGTAVYDSSQSSQSTPTTPLTSLVNTKYLMLGAAVTTDTSGVQTVTNNNTVTQSSVLKPF